MPFSKRSNHTSSFLLHVFRAANINLHVWVNAARLYASTSYYANAWKYINSIYWNSQGLVNRLFRDSKVLIEEVKQLFSLRPLLYNDWLWIILNSAVMNIEYSVIVADFLEVSHQFLLYVWDSLLNTVIFIGEISVYHNYKLLNSQSLSNENVLLRLPIRA